MFIPLKVKQTFIGLLEDFITTCKLVLMHAFLVSTSDLQMFGT